MNKAEEKLEELAKTIKLASIGKMFGMKSLKASYGKTAIFHLNESLTFKLNEIDQKEALLLKGARQGTHIYAPEKKMMSWITIPVQLEEYWDYYANKAINFVSEKEK